MVGNLSPVFQTLWQTPLISYFCTLDSIFIFVVFLYLERMKIQTLAFEITWLSRKTWLRFYYVRSSNSVFWQSRVFDNIHIHNISTNLRSQNTRRDGLKEITERCRFNNTYSTPILRVYPSPRTSVVQPTGLETIFVASFMTPDT